MRYLGVDNYASILGTVLVAASLVSVAFGRIIDRRGEPGVLDHRRADQRAGEHGQQHLEEDADALELPGLAGIPRCTCPCWHWPSIPPASRSICPISSSTSSATWGWTTTRPS